MPSNRGKTPFTSETSCILKQRNKIEKFDESRQYSDYIDL